MATRIRANCLSCGDVELTIEDLEVTICADDNSGVYRFDCPDCATAVIKDADPRVIDLLVASGVKLSTWSVPAEMLEPKTGAVFSHDDLIDFHHLLQTDTWFDGLVESLRGTPD